MAALDETVKVKEYLLTLFEGRLVAGDRQLELLNAGKRRQFNRGQAYGGVAANSNENPVWSMTERGDCGLYG